MLLPTKRTLGTNDRQRRPSAPAALVGRAIQGGGRRIVSVFGCAELDAGYGGVPVVRSFSLEAMPSEMVAILGANGAGKSTVLATLAGVLPRISGDITLDGHPLRTSKPHRFPALGISFVPDDRALFTTLTAKENLALAHASTTQRVDDVLDHFPALVPRLGIKAGMLSGGEQQMLALARALIAQPRVLLIDELSLGLAPVIAAELLQVVRRMSNERGTSVIFVEQHVHMALNVADRGVVMSHGQLVLSGSAAELQQDRKALESSYLGESDSAASNWSRS